MNNDFENELDKIRISLHDETKNLTFEQKKEREKNLLDKLSKEFNFEFLTENDDCNYHEVQNKLLDGMVSENMEKYNEEPHPKESD